MKTKQTPKKYTPLPPAAFSNVMADRNLPYDPHDWRNNEYWRVFVAGYNEAVREVNASTMAKYNMGLTAERVFASAR